MVNFELENTEADFILRVVGQLPTETKAFPLFEKLVHQFQLSLAKEQEQQQEEAK